MGVYVLKDKLDKINRLEKEIDHLIEFGNEEDDQAIGEKTAVLSRLQLEILEELKNTTFH